MADDDNESRAPSLRFSTDMLPPNDRLAIWREVFGRTVVRLDMVPLADTPFYSEAVLTPLPDLNLMTGVNPGISVQRTRTLITDGNDDVVISIPLAGEGVAAQLGRETKLAQGDAAVLSSADVGSVTFPHASRFLSIGVPRHLLKRRVPNLEDHFVERIPRDNPALRLIMSYVEAWHQGELAVTPELRRIFAGHMHDLIALAVGASGDAAATAAQRGGRAARLALIRREIDKGFADPDFSLTALARRVGVSPRYVQMLLAETASSFVDEVIDRRLKRAHDLLQSPRHSHLSITDIAYECGFTTVAHFHRLFRRRFSTTPGERRKGRR